MHPENMGEIVIPLSLPDLADQLHKEQEVRKSIMEASADSPAPISSPIPNHKFPESLVGHFIAGHLSEYIEGNYSTYQSVKVDGRPGECDILTGGGEQVAVKAITGLKSKPKLNITERDCSADKIWVVDFRDFIKRNKPIEIRPAVADSAGSRRFSELVEDNYNIFHVRDFFNHYRSPPYPEIVTEHQFKISEFDWV